MTKSRMMTALAIALLSRRNLLNESCRGVGVFSGCFRSEEPGAARISSSAMTKPGCNGEGATVGGVVDGEEISEFLSAVSIRIYPFYSDLMRGSTTLYR